MTEREKERERESEKQEWTKAKKRIARIRNKCKYESKTEDVRKLSRNTKKYVKKLRTNANQQCCEASVYIVVKYQSTVL